jgi:hypothetical protein
MTDTEAVLDPEPGRRARFAARDQQEARVCANLGERLFDDALETESGQSCRLKQQNTANCTSPAVP